MADYLQLALRDHPRTRRLGELLADIMYPLTSSVLNSGFIPVPGALIRSVEALKQTSDYIFQPPYERLLHQIDENRRLKQRLESDLLSSQEEYQSLRCAHISCGPETETLRAEHSLAVRTQKNTFERQIKHLEVQMLSLSSRLEALMLQLARKDEENEMLKESLEGKENALVEALKALESVRIEKEELDRQIAAEGQREVVSRPKVDTSYEYGREMEYGILTPKSMEELRDFGSPQLVDLAASAYTDPASVALPSDTEDSLEEDDRGDDLASGEKKKEEDAIEKKEEEKIEEDDPPVVDTNTNIHTEAKVDIDDVEKQPSVEEHPQEERQQEQQVIEPKVQGTESVSDVVETSNDTTAPTSQEDATAPTTTISPPGKVEEEDKEKGEASSSPEIDPQHAAPAAQHDGEASQTPIIPIPTIGVVDLSSPDDVYSPAVIKSDFVPFGEQRAQPPRQQQPEQQQQQRGGATTSSGTGTTTDTVHDGKQSTTGHGHDHHGGKRQSQYVYNTFGFGAPSPAELNFGLKANGNGNGAVGGEGEGEGGRKKRHSFFGRHERPDVEGGGDKDSKEKDHKPSLRARVFSTPDAVSNTKSGTTGSDEESLNSSSGHSKKRGSGSQDRPDSPSSFGKLTRRHSRFETYIIDPLERKASQVVKKGRELLRHSDSKDSVRRSSSEHHHQHQHQTTSTTQH